MTTEIIVKNKNNDNLKIDIPTNSDYVKAWDGLRGFFTIFVVLSHLNILRNAWIVIGFFFGHSGILITSMTFNILEKKGEINLLMFYHRRIARIIPGALLVIFSCCLYVLYITTYYPDQMSRIELYWQRSDMLWATFYGSNWQLITKGEDYFAQYNNLTLLRHFWSLAIEEQYYIVWPILLLLWMFLVPVILQSLFNTHTKNKSTSSLTVSKDNEINSTRHRLSFRSVIISVLVGDVIVLLMSSMYQYYMMQVKTPQYVIYYSTIIHLKEFALGGAGAAIVRLIPSLQGLMHSQRPYVPKYSFHQRLFIEMCIGMLMVYPLYLVTLADWKNDEDVFIWYFNYGIFPPLVVVITDILLAIQAKEMIEVEFYYFPVSRLFLSSDFIVFLGRISYQTYLWHVPIIVWTNTACKEGVDTECIINAVVVIAFIYFFTAMMSAFYEFPMQKYILSFKDARKVIACLLLTMITLAGLICLVTSNYEDPYAYVELEKSVQEFNDDANNIISLPDVVTYDHDINNKYKSSDNKNNHYDNNNHYNLHPHTQHNGSHFYESSSSNYSTVVNKNSNITSKSNHKNKNNQTLINNSTIFDRMKSNIQKANTYNNRKYKDSYRTVFLQDIYISFPINEFHSMLRDVLNNGRQLKYNEFFKENKHRILIILYSNSLSDCDVINTYSDLLHKGLNTNYFLYIYRTVSLCPKLSSYINGSSSNFISFDVNLMNPKRPYLRDIYHPARAYTYLYHKPEMLSIQEIKLISYVIIDYLVTCIPDTIKYFKPMVFQEFQSTYDELIVFNQHKIERPSIVKQQKYHIAYLGNSVAERYAYFLEHMRLRILSSCKTFYEDNLHTSDKEILLTTKLYESLSKISIGNAAHANYKVLSDLLSDKKELQIKKDYIINNHVTTVIIEDSDYIAHFLGSYYLHQSTSNINKPNSWFSKLLMFLNMLSSIGVERVYLHDANHLNRESIKIFKSYDINDVHLGYKTIITAFDENFKLCEKFNTRSSNQDNSNKYWLGTKKLLELKMMLHIVDVSSLTCPIRFVNSVQEIECNRNAWGYNPILSDGEHPSGKAGEFLGANILSQIIQDFYLDVLLSTKSSSHSTNSSSSKNNLTQRRRVLNNSTLSLLTTSTQLPLCTINDIKLLD